MSDLSKNFLLAAVLFAGILISYSVFENYGLDVLQKIFSIVGSFSLGVALLTYFNKKKQDEVLASIDQITFFREKIIPEWDAVKKVINNKDPEFQFSRIKFDQSNIENIKEKFSANFDRQLSIFFNASILNQNKWIDNSILDRQVFLLNMIEEFALKVSHLKTSRSQALKAVHGAFVEIIEQNAVALIFMRDVVVSSSVIYSATLELYFSWKDEEEKSNYIKNLAKFGFITREQKDEAYKRKRENISKIKVQSQKI